MLAFTSFSITHLEKLTFMSKDCLFIQEWAIDRKPIDRRFQKYNFQTVISSSFCCKGPWSSINHKVRNRKMLAFTSFSITQLGKLTFMSNDCLFMQQRAIDRKVIDCRFQKYNFHTVINSSFCCKGPWSSINHKVRNWKMLAFTSFSITQLEKFILMSKDCLFVQQWAIDRKTIDRRFQKYICQTVISSSFCCKGPWSSINHKVRNRKMLAFTSVSITQLEKLTFISKDCLFMQQWGIDRKSIDRRFLKCNFQTVKISSFCCKGPWSSINHKVRNGKMLAFTSFSITHLEKLTFMSKDCLFMQEWAIDRKPIDRRFQKYNFQTVIKSSSCCKGPWSSINHKVRNRKMLAFTSFSITQLEKFTFYVQRLSFYATTSHRQKVYWP